MKERLFKTGKFLGDTAVISVFIIMSLIMLFLFSSSMILTADMSANDHDLEVLTFLPDNAVLNIFLMICCFIFGISIYVISRHFKLTERFSLRHLSYIIFAVVFLNCVLWIVQALSFPTHDSYLVTSAGVSASLGDTSPFEKDYFLRFPFQLGYVLWTEFFARIFFLDHEKYVVLQIINGVCLAAAETALLILTDRLFSNRNVTFFTFVMLILFSQPVIFTTFLYGNIPGFAFAVWSVLFAVEFIRRTRWRDIIISSLLMTVSVWLKLNDMIFLVALAIVLFLCFLRKKGIKPLVSLCVMCIVVLGLKGLPVWQYEQRFDRSFGEGIPMTCWLAMGLNESENAPGWYNSTHTVITFNSVKGDHDAANDIAKKTVKERIDVFAKDPAYALSFFCDKINSQWNETSFQSIWNNQVRGQMGDRIGVAKYVCENGEKTVDKLMDVNVEFIYLGALIAFVVSVIDMIRKKELKTELVIIPIVIIGGFLYHALFEAKSQYVINYVTIMIPYSVYGFYRCLSALKNIKNNALKNNG